MSRKTKKNKFTRIKFLNRQDFRGLTWKWIKKKMRLIDDLFKIELIRWWKDKYVVHVLNLSIQ